MLRHAPFHSIRLPLLTALGLVLFFVAVNCCWPEGALYLHRKLHFLKESAAVAVLEQFAEKLFHGEPLAEVFSGFFNGLQL